MKNIFLLSLFIAILVISEGCSLRDEAVHKKLDEIALNLNESTPVMLDQYTRFDKALVTPENTFQYIYTVLNSSNPDSLIRAATTSLKENIKTEFATNPQLRFFKENNVMLEYVYNDENNKTVSILRIEPEDYQ